jgi:RNA polymerase sigma factor (sigma-70 family)
VPADRRQLDDNWQEDGTMNRTHAREGGPSTAVGMEDEPLPELVCAATRGSQDAWGELLDKFSPWVVRVARGCGLSHWDAADVSQATWLKLFENLHRIRDAQAVGAWLAITARRESLRMLHRRRHEVVTAEHENLRHADAICEGPWSPEHAALASERSRTVRQALQHFSPQLQRFLGMLMLEPPPTYKEIAEATGMPVGSIGPTRARCLRRLRVIPDVARLHPMADASEA